MKCRSRRTILGAAVAVALSAGAPALASATTWCVSAPACAGVTESGSTGLQLALSDAAGHSNSGGADVVVIGAGTFTRTGGFSYSGDAVTIEGAGRGKTILGDSGAKQETVLSLSTVREGSTPNLQGLTIDVPKGEEEKGLALTGGLVDEVAIEGSEPTAFISDGLLLRSGVFENGSIEMVPDDTEAVEVQGSGEVLSSTLKGGYVVQGGNVTIRACRLYGKGTLLDAYQAGDTIEDSLFDLEGGKGPALEYAALHKGDVATMVLRSVSILDGGEGSVGIKEEAYTPESGTAHAGLTLQSSLMSGITHPVEQVTESAGASAAATVEYSSLGSEMDTQEAYESGAEPTLTILDAAVGEADFLDPILGEGSFAADWRLSPRSALIDAGAPGALAEGEYASDLAGNPRISNGRRDVGAYEYEWPSLSASASASSASVGQAVEFTGSGDVFEGGDSIVSYQWSFDDGASVPSGANAAHAFSTPGVHSATLTATDAFGAKVSASVSVSVSAPVVLGKELPPTPLLSALHLSPVSFRAARSGGSLAKGHVGTKVTYSGAGGVRIEFEVEKVESGVRSGRSCLARKKGRRGKSCSRLAAVAGSFARTSVNGANSLRFSGRIGGRTLKPGRYELTASWTQEGESKRASVAFRVLAAG